MTPLEKAIAFPKDFLLPKHVAPCLGMAEQTFRVLVRNHPERFKFPFIISGQRTIVPKFPFLRYMGVNVDEEA